MAKKQGGMLATVVGVGAGLHAIHEAVDGYQWLARFCWCRLRRGGSLS
jgi:hypothetical protein